MKLNIANTSNYYVALLGSPKAFSLRTLLLSFRIKLMYINTD
nr:MAG TPA: hypothetical protein [Crassvirales sp.]